MRSNAGDSAPLLGSSAGACEPAERGRRGARGLAATATDAQPVVVRPVVCPERVPLGGRDRRLRDGSR